ncbi:MAG: hypothetical protein RIT15_667 [Pseudomonadota bacterium]|jgi:hypothetical protein
MKNFLAIFNGTHAAMGEWNKMDEATRKARMAQGMAAWMAWKDAHASNMVDAGTPLGKTKRIDKNGIADATNSMTGYVIVKAESHEAAAAMFTNHPHFAIFPGDNVEIMPCTELPKM